MSPRSQRIIDEFEEWWAPKARRLEERHQENQEKPKTDDAEPEEEPEGEP